MAANHFVQSLKIDERRRPDSYAIGLRGAIADDVVAKNAFRAFYGVIDLPGRRLQNFADTSHDGPGGNIFDGLETNKARLPHLFNAHHVAIIGVSICADGNLKFVLVVGRVWRGLAQIPFHAAGAKHRTTGAESDAIGGIQKTDVAGPANPDAVAGEQIGIFLDAAFEILAESLDVLFKRVVGL